MIQEPNTFDPLVDPERRITDTWLRSLQQLFGFARNSAVYATDAAAAAGGVAIGEQYRKTGGVMAWRVT